MFTRSRFPLRSTYHFPLDGSRGAPHSESMKSLIVLPLTFAVLIPTVWADPPDKPSVKVDVNVATLIDILKEADGRGGGKRAAKQLAEINALDALREILLTTDRRETIHAIAATQDVRLLPTYAEMLGAKPTDARLAASLAHMKSPKVANILLGVVTRNPDDGDKDQERALEAALSSLRANQALSALPEVRKRFAACDPEEKLGLKCNYALTMFWLGDDGGIPFLKELLESGRKASPKTWPLETLASLLQHHQMVEGTNIPDLGALEPLLPALVSEARDSSRGLYGSSSKILTLLTKDGRFRGRGHPGWVAWYEKHGESHPIYTEPLHRAVQESGRLFHKALQEAGERSDDLALVHQHATIVPKVRNRGARILYKISSVAPNDTPEQGNHYVTFSVARVFKHGYPRVGDSYYRREFPSLNIAIGVGVQTDNEQMKNHLFALAKKAEAPLVKYVRSLGKEPHAADPAVDPSEVRLKEIKPSKDEDPAPSLLSKANRAAVKVQGDFTIAPFKSAERVWGDSNRYLWTKIPAAFQERSFFFTQFDSKHHGLTEFEVRSEGKVYVAVTSRWGGGGNASGGWTKELTSKEEFLAEGWKKVAKIGEERSDSSHSFHWTIYERDCQKGERFRLRTEKYCAPIVLF